MPQCDPLPYPFTYWAYEQRRLKHFSHFERKCQMASKIKKKQHFRCQEKCYVNRKALIMASKSRKNVSFDAMSILHVHRRRERSVLVHMGRQRKCRKRPFSMPISISNCFFLIFRARQRSIATIYQVRRSAFFKALYKTGQRMATTATQAAAFTSVATELIFASVAASS